MVISKKHDTIINFLRQNKIEEALKSLEMELEMVSEPFIHYIIISASYYRLRRAHNFGTISREELNIGETRIIRSILELLNELNKVIYLDR